MASASDWPWERCGPNHEEMDLQLQIRPFRFALIRPLRTAAGVLQDRCGWLLRLQATTGATGWGEVAPLDQSRLPHCQQQLAALPSSLSREHLETLLPQLPGALGFGLGAALAELDGLVGPRSRHGWLAAPNGAQLLPAGGLMLSQLDRLLEQRGRRRAMTFKWKVAAEADGLERRWLEQLMQRLPSTALLRLDANGGWDRSTAKAWMQALVGDPRFAWLDRWTGWQVRRPALEGDPRPLLRQLQEGVPWRMVSTAFESGIGRRWLNHLAALQMTGPTPAAPGLAPGWCPSGPLFSADPSQVWAAAGI